MPGPTTEKGHSVGLATTDGLPFDPSEWTPELTWPLNVQVYDLMRSDAKVKSVYNAVTLPIRRSPWRLDPNDAPQATVDQIAAELGIPVLGSPPGTIARRRRHQIDFNDHVRLACLSLIYGHQAFEIAGEIGDDGRWHLRRLDVRLPPTIQRIHVARTGDLEGIDQYRSGIVGDVGQPINIPASALVFYSHEREGGIWQGRSILRSAFKHYLIKDRLLRVDAMKHERNGLGIPFFKAPPNASPAVLEELNRIAAAWRAGEQSGGAVPAGTEIMLKGVDGSLPDTLASIRYHDEQIGEESLSQFLDLGTSETGSRALGAAFIDFFLLAEQAIADELASTLNTMLIEPWVDWNDGEDIPAPVIVPGDLGADHSITAEALAELVRFAVITADDDLEQFIRSNYRMPPRMPGPRKAPEPAQGIAAPAAAPVAADRGGAPFPDDGVGGGRSTMEGQEVPPGTGRPLRGAHRPGVDRPARS